MTVKELIATGKKRLEDEGFSEADSDCFILADYLLGISKEDSFTEKKTQEKLLPREKALVQLFEEFMLYKQQKETKK